MKKKILCIALFCFFALIVSGTSLFADIGLGGRLDAGLDLFTYLPSMTTSPDDGMSVLPVIPMLDLGVYGQFNAGILNFGAGARAFSVILVNVFMPSVYAELNIWRFSLNAQISGGAFYLFPALLMAGPYFLPEISLWFTAYTFNKKDVLRFGVGAAGLMGSKNITNELFSFFSDQNFSNRVVFYVALKAVLHQPWITWKRER
ncbi:MAG: hypothetical protein LBU85_03585 [Treponema sp.]|jgi:hypothetical protein|nr:hypothetical protein [Treponema sp.]